MVFNEFYHSIIEHNPDAVFVLSLDGEIMKINNMVTKVFGYSQKEVEKAYFQDLIIPKYKEEFYYHLSEALQGIPYENEFDAYHKNGESLHLQVKSIPLTTQNKIVGIFCVVIDLTELQRTKRMEERFKAVFNSSADAIDILDLDGNIIDVNHGFEKLYGWKREEVIGRPLPIIPKYRLAESLSFIERAKSGEEIKETDVACIRKDGTTITISLTFSPIKDSSGNIVAVSGIARDVTVQKQLEKSLMESEERYHKFVEYTPKGVVVHEDGRICYANPSALKILKEDSLIGNSIFSYIHPDYLENYKHRISEIEEGIELPFTEIKMLQKDGKVICAEIGGVSIQNDGSPVILTLFGDVTDRLNVEKELRESEERYRLLADNSLDLIQLVNLDGIVTYASPSHSTVLGYDSEEYVGKMVFYQPDGGKDEQFKKGFLKMAFTQKSFTYEIVRKHKDGNNVWVELKGTPMFDDGGNFKYFIIVGREITERRKFEEHLEYLGFHDALTGIPNRRLFQDRLEQAIKEAKENHRKLAVMYMDMDKFKQINDTLGHDVGDELLKQSSNRVKRYLRVNDTFARQGGDEFTVLLSDIQEEADAYKVAERILNSLQEAWQIGDHIFRTTSSIGIAFYPKDGNTPHELLKHADTALYEVKKDGRNNYKAYQV